VLATSVPYADGVAWDVVPISLTAVTEPSEPDWTEVSDEIDPETGNAALAESLSPSLATTESNSFARPASVFILAWDAAATRAGPTLLPRTT